MWTGSNHVASNYDRVHRQLTSRIGKIFKKSKFCSKIEILVKIEIEILVKNRNFW